MSLFYWEKIPQQKGYREDNKNNKNTSSYYSLKNINPLSLIFHLPPPPCHHSPSKKVPFAKKLETVATGNYPLPEKKPIPFFLFSPEPSCKSSEKKKK